jgi:hypothetical protein
MKLNFTIPKIKLPSTHPFDRGEFDYVRPTQHWTIGLSIAALMFVCGVSFIVYDFRRQFNIPDEPVSVAPKKVEYNEVEVTSQAKIYREREEEFNRMLSDGRYVIPSQPLPQASVFPSSSEALAEEAVAE